MTGFFGVGVVASPGEEGGILEGAGKRESDGPGVRAVLDDGGEVIGGLLGGLATREKDYAGEFGWDVTFKNFRGFGADFIWGGLMVLLFAGEDHVDF